MNNQVLYIDENDIKGSTSVQKNVSAHLLTPFIYDAQVLYIDDFLGQALKTELDNQILSGTTAVTTEMVNLLNYIKPALVNFTVYEAIPYLRAKITDKGIVYKDSEFSSFISDDYELVLRKNVINKAEKYMAKLKYFLEQNETLYPLWKVKGDCSEFRTNDDSPYFGGIEF